MEYKVAWLINIDADSPRKAAEAALDIQRSCTDAVIFNVTDEDGKETIVDLYDAE